MYLGEAERHTEEEVSCGSRQLQSQVAPADGICILGMEWNQGWSIASLTQCSTGEQSKELRLTEPYFCHCSSASHQHHPSAALQQKRSSSTPAVLASSARVLSLNVHSLLHFQEQVEAWVFQALYIPALLPKVSAPHQQRQKRFIVSCAVQTIWKFQLHVACPRKYLSCCLCWAAPHQFCAGGSCWEVQRGCRDGDC